MACKEVFCNSPWYELHIFWDGSLGYCCQQNPYVPYPKKEASKYNIKNISIAEWQNSEPMRKHRLAMDGLIGMKECYACWHQEEYSNTSRRIKSNLKSVIFSKQQFQHSYLQSPNYSTFQHSFTNSGETSQLPVDLHIDLGNYCNLACKFCCPEASSTIATQYSKWNILKSTSLSNDWTKDDKVWNRFVTEVLELPQLQNIHFMGGETVITPRFEDLIDVLIKNKRFDVCISFVTNGTIINERVLSKLLNFKRVGIEVSIETVTKHNEYIRQGTDNEVVIANIKRYMQVANGVTVDVTIRPAVSLLSVGYYYTLLQFCLDNKLLLKSNDVLRGVGWQSSPCLSINVLPIEIREQYKENYINLRDKIQPTELIADYNESDPTNYKTVLYHECVRIIQILSEPDINHALFPDLIELLSKWDRSYHFNARELYPEFAELFNQYNYVS